MIDSANNYKDNYILEISERICDRKHGSRQTLEHTIFKLTKI